MGMCGPEDPLFHASPAVRKGPISSKRFSSQDPLLRKFGNFSLYSLNFCPNFSPQAPKFGNFQLTSPQIWKFSVHKSPNLEIFSSQAPLSEGNIISQAPHFGNSGRTPLPEKNWVPPRLPQYFAFICMQFILISVQEALLTRLMISATKLLQQETKIITCPMFLHWVCLVIIVSFVLRK